jgi:hypothetical protein
MDWDTFGKRMVFILLFYIVLVFVNFCPALALCWQIKYPLKHLETFNGKDM